MIIGISGYARVGKDTAADFLEAEYGFIRIGFADILREALYIQNPIVGFQLGETGVTPVRVQDVIDKCGWGSYKEQSPYADEIRRLLQVLGTDVGRKLISPDVWVEAAFKNIDPNKDYVFPDTRFPNEAKIIEKHGGLIFRIERDGVKPINNHESETGLDGWDFHIVIHNNGTIKELQEDVVSGMVDIFANVPI